MGKTSSRSEGKPRAGRKFEKKVKFYESVRDVVSQKTICKEKQEKKRSRQRKKSFDMSSLSKYLPEVKDPEESKTSDSFDLSSLSKYLPEVKDPKVSKTSKVALKNRRRNEFLVKEVTNARNRAREMYANPRYLSDPWGFLYQSLLDKLPPEKPKKKPKATELDYWFAGLLYASSEGLLSDTTCDTTSTSFFDIFN